MDDGERRYHYKGGGGGDYSVTSHKGKHGGHSHYASARSTFFTNYGFGPPRVWVTYTSPADDGINWKFIDGHHLPKLDCTYPLSIGVYPTINPEWGIGQFPIEGRYIGLAYLRIL